MDQCGNQEIILRIFTIPEIKTIEVFPKKIFLANPLGKGMVFGFYTQNIKNLFEKPNKAADPAALLLKPEPSIIQALYLSIFYFFHYSRIK